MEAFRELMPQVHARWKNRSDLTFQFPGGELRQAFFRRVGETLDEIVARHQQERIAIVAHGGTIRAGLAHLFPDTMRDWWAYALSNGSLTQVLVGADSHVLAVLNDVHHLDGEAEND